MLSVGEMVKVINKLGVKILENYTKRKIEMKLKVKMTIMIESGEELTLNMRDAINYAITQNKHITISNGLDNKYIYIELSEPENE